MIGLLFFLLFLFLWVFQAVYRRIWYKDLTLTLRFGEPAVFAGGKASLQEIIENRKRFPVPVLEAGFRIRKGIQFEDETNTTTSDYLYKRDIFSLLGREQITRTHTLECPRRGHYTFSQVTLVSYSILHTRRYIREASSDASLYVYAGRTQLSGILPALDRILGEIESTRKLYEDPFSFSLIRPYTIQDPMKTINWKASAKAMELMVNTYSSVRSHRFRIFLDVSDPLIIRQEPLTEESIRLAATLSSRLLGQNQSVSFCVNACPKDEDRPFFLPEARGAGQACRIEQFLTTDFAKARLTDFAALVRDVTKRTSCDTPFTEPEIPLFISKNADSSLQEQLLAAIGPKVTGIWIIPVYAHESLPIPECGSLRLIPKEVS